MELKKLANYFKFSLLLWIFRLQFMVGHWIWGLGDNPGLQNGWVWGKAGSYQQGRFRWGRWEAPSQDEKAVSAIHWACVALPWNPSSVDTLKILHQRALLGRSVVQKGHCLTRDQESEQPPWAQSECRGRGRGRTLVPFPPLWQLHLALPRPVVQSKKGQEGHWAT
jgi:hypothetical protein